MPLTTEVGQELSPVPAGIRTDAAWLSLFGDFQSLLADLPASWGEAIAVADRRAENRFWCDSRARLTPIDDLPGRPEAAPISVVLTDISRHGIGFSHSEPLPYRLVQVAIGQGDPSSPILVVRLQWCRFRKPGAYESGGQIQRIVLPEAGP